VDHGAYLVARRGETLVALDELAHTIHGELTENLESLHLRYVPSVEHTLSPADGTGGEPALDLVKEAFQHQLQVLRQREIAAGMTLVGPHRDEMRFLINDVDAGVYGSRGQQRTAALALKLAEVGLMRRETGEHPVLLLDDVLSELDIHRRRFLLGYLDDGPQQAVISATDLDILPEAFLRRCQLWRVQMGQLSAVDTDTIEADGS
jgi:DNA replication and repair protein RecF